MRTKRKGHATGTIAAVWLAAWAQQGYALGLSEAQIRSSLGDRLDAEITLYGDDVLQPHIEARVLNNDRLQPIALHTTLEPDGDRQWTLHIRTTEPLWEPALNITVEVVDGGMRVQRAIAVLLDPPPMTRMATREREPAVTPHPVVAAPQRATPAEETIVAVSESPADAPAVVAAPIRSHAEHRQATRRAIREPVRTARSEPPSEPLRRFQLSSQLSTESLALLQDGPATSEVASTDAAPGDASALAAPASPAAAEPGAPAASSLSIDTALIAAAVAAVPPSGSADSEQAAALVNAEREARINAAREAGRDGFFLLAPFKVFFTLALLATLLFGQAGRLRRQMMDQFEQFA